MQKGHINYVQHFGITAIFVLSFVFRNFLMQSITYRSDPSTGPSGFFPSKTPSGQLTKIVVANRGPVNLGDCWPTS
jgi:hypothetical protein